jgi:putative nucleotidyltransferase with HDIG domain
MILTRDTAWVTLPSSVERLRLGSEVESCNGHGRNPYGLIGSLMSLAATNRVIDLLTAHATVDYIGESISQLEHALQCAHFARRAHAKPDAVVAALLHDIGHLVDPSAPQMAGLGTCDHERLGAQWLRALGMRESVVRLVEGHVQAKRFLAFSNPRYRQRLSAASLGTLAFQGGPMTPQEATDFQQDPDHKRMLALRQWDEQAKEIDLCVAPLETYRPFIASQFIGAGSLR